jgi:hypothetical protein
LVNLTIDPRSTPPSDLQPDYSLTDDFCRNHFLVGLLLREVGGALQGPGEVRQVAIQVLKSLMMKHTFDDRYAAKVSRKPLPPHGGTHCYVMDDEVEEDDEEEDDDDDDNEEDDDEEDDGDED